MTNAHDRNGSRDSRSAITLEAATARTDYLMEALVAAYALMAHADGEVAGAERRKFFSIVRDTPMLSAFSREDVAEEAAVHEANFRLDAEIAQQIAREGLQPIVGQSRAVRLVIAACREIIPADGVAHPGEYRMLAEIKSLLGFEDRSPAPGQAMPRAPLSRAPV